jgi:hypothetical protein
MNAPQVRTRGDDEGRFMLGPSILCLPARIKELPRWSHDTPPPETGAGVFSPRCLTASEKLAGSPSPREYPPDKTSDLT